jgi:UDP-N-acetylglucosamine 2-epimerase (non-hydrolysing)
MIYVFSWNEFIQPSQQRPPSQQLEYVPFVALMDRCTLILTDSGGIQEEAPSLGKPVLVMREVTERPEGIKAGTARLVETDRSNIIEGVAVLLTDSKALWNMSETINPFGDGTASQRIIERLKLINHG